MTAGQLSRLEWSVVAVARRDRLSSLRQPGRIGRVMRWLRGRPIETALANKRLESLRRVAVLAWHHGCPIPPREVLRFLEQGFTKAQYATLMASIAATRGAGRCCASDHSLTPPLLAAA